MRKKLYDYRKSSRLCVYCGKSLSTENDCVSCEECRERCKTHNRAYRKSHGDYFKAYYENHKDYFKAYYENHKNYYKNYYKDYYQQRKTTSRTSRLKAPFKQCGDMKFCLNCPLKRCYLDEC